MPHRASSTDLPHELLTHMQRIKAKAIDYGLDFFEVVFEVLDFETMNQIAAFGGFPIRYPHWKWGMEYERLSKRDAYGLGRIYEMVINNDPCYAYLQESNSVTDQKLVMAHVYGHADFFKHNLWFGRTNRKMMDEMANHATRVRRHIERQGQEAVERFIDACLSIEHLIDPHSMFQQRERRRIAREDAEGFVPERFPAKDYMDPFINPQQEIERQRELFEEQQKARKSSFPAQPTRDVLLFLMRNAPLEDWQQDVLSIIRSEAYYYAPQAMTKVMNEGWATYWHSKLMTEHFLEASEIVHYADQHSGVVHMPAGGFNPYKIGVEIWKDIERRWNMGQHGHEWERLDTIGARERYDDGSMKGREKMFEVRRIYNDVNFIDEFLTPELMDRLKMYQYRRDPNTGELRIVSRDHARIRQGLLYQITNMGQPFIYVVDANYLNRGDLYLSHQFSGLEIDASKAVEVLKALNVIWSRPVHLQTRINDEMWLLSCRDGGAELSREKISEETPPPAHMIF
ncbi:MAG: SpoVR family protein [Phycisphaeraceae bacterium]|nr:SpoVR family protein [Phycisphaeraceae bacterium]MCW5754786.1 SpoVR family protein [Phycisphaeraceae bacterium]